MVRLLSRRRVAPRLASHGGTESATIWFDCCLLGEEPNSKLRPFFAAGLSSGTPCGTYVRGVFANVRQWLVEEAGASLIS